VKDHVAVREDDRVAHSCLQRIRREPRRARGADDVDGQLDRWNRAVRQWRGAGCWHRGIRGRNAFRRRLRITVVVAVSIRIDSPKRRGHDGRTRVLSSAGNRRRQRRRNRRSWFGASPDRAGAGREEQHRCGFQLHDAALPGNVDTTGGRTELACFRPFSDSLFTKCESTYLKQQGRARNWALPLGGVGGGATPRAPERRN
jgi:hypothetical protein